MKYLEAAVIAIKPDDANASERDVPLGQLVSGAVDTGCFLRLAIQIAGALADLHRRNVIHGNLTPRTIRVDPRTCAVTFTGLMPSPGTRQEYPAERPEEALAYLSPEQTGRMNRTVDYRTDLYSLGIVFYRLLTGVLPFQARDPIEWAHSHIARTPKPPAAVDPAIPAAVSGIVIKLLAKAAEDRYQTAAGLKYDLEQCLARWETTNEIRPFALGEQDIPDRLLIPQKLYGRERDIDTLMSAFGQVAGTGAARLVMVSGYSGIGKTSLVRELYRPVIDKRGYFISGKFDQYKRNIPYSTIVEAFQELIRQILTESEERIARWKTGIMSAVGINARLIVDIIPQVGLIVGAQPPVPELPPAEAQNRFNIVFRQFIGVFTSEEHPLVIFLDDMQWVDSASLKLIENVLTHPGTRFLLLIGAYRDNEVTPSHPLIATLEDLRQRKTVIRDIKLSPLSFDNLSGMIAETLRSGREHIRPLAELVYEKTGGNPFFVVQFLTALYEEKLLEFDATERQWKWDIRRIRAKGYSDNIIDLLTGRLNKLPARSRSALMMASCIGNSFDLGMLTAICSLPAQETREAVREALQQGLIIGLSDTSYMFAHDRTRQSANSLLPEEVRTEKHLLIGRMMLATFDEPAVQEHVFEIAEQFDSALSLISDPTEKRRIAAINLLAAQKSILSTAYKSARQFAQAAWTLLQPADWAGDYSLQRQLHEMLAKAEFLSGNLARSKELISDAIGHLDTNLEKAEFYDLLIVGQTLEGVYEDAVESGHTGLKLLGVDLPAGDPERSFREEVAEIEALMIGRQPADLLGAPLLTDPVYMVAQKILLDIDVPAYISAPEIYPLIIARMVQISMIYGNSSESCKSYANYGLLLGSIYGQYQRGYEFAKLGWELVGRLGAIAHKCKTAFPWIVTQAWIRPLRETLPLFQEGINAGYATGDIQFIGYLIATQAHFHYVAGTPLPRVLAMIEDALPFAATSKNQWMTDSLHALYYTVLPLLSYGSPAAVSAAEAEFLADCTRRGNLSSMCLYHCYRTQRLIYAGDYAAALEHAEKAQAMVMNILGSPVRADASFYHALALTGLLSAGSADESKVDGYRKQIRENLARLKGWRDACPANFDHKYLLADAEISGIEGEGPEPMRRYEQAIRSVQESEFVQDAGTCCLLASLYYRKTGFDRFADADMRDARKFYLRWGANAMVKVIDEKCPRLYEEERAAARIGGLDAISVIKASQAISGEIQLPQLLSTMMRIVIENAGAQKGYLLTEADGKWTIAAEGYLEKSDTRVPQAASLEECDCVSVSVVQYVAHTSERVVLDDAAVSEPYANDPYIRRHGVKSVLCAPLLSGGRVIGIMYLENDLAARVFTPERVQLLEALLSQAAVSLENALVYEALRDSEERFKQLADSSPIPLALYDASETIVYLNDKFTRTYGYTLEDIPGLKQWWPRAYPDPAYRRKVMAQWAEHVENAFRDSREIEPMEATVTCKDGSLRQVEFSGAAIGNMKLVVLQDITERKRAEEALRRSEEKFRIVADNTYDWEFWIGPDDRFIYVSPSCKRITGYTAREFIRNPGLMHEIVDPEDRHLFDSHLKSREKTHVHGDFEYRIVARDGSRKWIHHLCQSVFDAGGRYIGTRGNNRDITESKLAEDALKDAKAQAELYLDLMGHDIRNLNQIGMGFLEIALDSPDIGPADKELLSKSMGSLERSTHLIDNVRKLQKARSRELTINEIDACRIIRRVIGHFSSLPGVKVHFRCEIPDSCPVMANDLLYEVFENLIGNAIKHGLPEPVIGIRLEQASADGRSYDKFIVEDNGPGIADAKKRRLFHRLQMGETRAGGGGIGLCLVKSLVDSYRGQIWVEDRIPGDYTRGARFVVMMPVFQKER